MLNRGEKDGFNFIFVYGMAKRKEADIRVFGNKKMKEKEIRKQKR